MFFEDNKPMDCDEGGSCRVKENGCEQTSECAPLGAAFICGLSHRCFDTSEAISSGFCDEPVYPVNDSRDEILFVGSLIDRAGDGAAIENGIRLAIEEFNEYAELVVEGHRKVAWFACDTRGDKIRALEIARFLVGSSDSASAVGASALIGPLADDVFSDVVEQVSLVGNLNTFTISPTAIVESFGPEDPGRVIWRAGPGATRYAHAMLDRLNDVAPVRLLTIFSTAPRQWELFNSIAVKKVTFGQERWWINIDDVNGEMGPQAITSYGDVEQIAAAVEAAISADLGGPPDTLILLGGDETGLVLEEYVEQGGVIPPLILAPRWGVTGIQDALTRIADGQVQTAIELISPEMPNPSTTSAFTSRYSTRFQSTPPIEAHQAYDATLITLFSMAGVTDGTIVGPKISSVMRALLNGDAPVISAADPGNTFEAGASALANGNDVALNGAAYRIQIDAARREVCTDFVAYSPDDIEIARYQVNCPVEITGSW
ncbi:MAG: hypothetical protein KC468_23465 [Myxococcales bacterium]|nr:hypothetical protein [Myxococcales bacterium]